LKNAANISIYLTDDPCIQVQNLFVDIQRVEVKVEDDGVDSLGGWFNLNVRSGVYDILRFKNGIDTLFATGQIPAGRKLQKLRLTLGNNNRVVVGGATFPLSLHNNESQIIIKLDESTVDVIGGGDIRFWLDFDAGRSVQGVLQGRELPSGILQTARRAAVLPARRRTEGGQVPQEVPRLPEVGNRHLLRLWLAQRRSHRKRRHHFLAAGRIADHQRLAFLHLFHAHDALDRQVEYARVAEFLAQALLGRVDHQGFLLLVEDDVADLGETPPRARRDMVCVELQSLALAQESDLEQFFVALHLRILA